MPHYFDYFELPEAAELVRTDADFLRRLIYPAALADEIAQPRLYTDRAPDTARR